MKVKKLGKNYEVIFVKREELIQYGREHEELNVVPEDVLQNNLLNQDAVFYFYITTQHKQKDDTVQYKGYVVLRKYDKVTGIFNFDNVAKDISIQDLKKLLDKVVSMSIDRAFPYNKFEHNGNAEYITIARQLGFDVTSNALIATYQYGDDIAATTMLLA